MPGFFLGFAVFDTNWEMIDGDTAHEIEVLNLANQTNVIEALVRYFIHHKGVEEKGCPVYPAKPAIKELHRTATFLLLSRPGEFRGDADRVVVADKDGKVVFSPPSSDQVEEQLDKLYGMMAANWAKGDAVELASLALWMVNYVHPFKNGNGRTARAFSYTCLSLKLGFVLAGSPTVIDLIMQNRDRYYGALAHADKGYHDTGFPALDQLNEFIEELLVVQFESVEVSEGGGDEASTEQLK